MLFLWEGLREDTLACLSQLLLAVTALCHAQCSLRHPGLNFSKTVYIFSFPCQMAKGSMICLAKHDLLLGQAMMVTLKSCRNQLTGAFGSWFWGISPLNLTTSPSTEQINLFTWTYGGGTLCSGKQLASTKRVSMWVEGRGFQSVIMMLVWLMKALPLLFLMCFYNNNLKNVFLPYILIIQASLYNIQVPLGVCFLFTVWVVLLGGTCYSLSLFIE